MAISKTAYERDLAPYHTSGGYGNNAIPARDARFSSLNNLTQGPQMNASRMQNEYINQQFQASVYDGHFSQASHPRPFDHQQSGSNQVHGGHYQQASPGSIPGGYPPQSTQSNQPQTSTTSFPNHAPPVVDEHSEKASPPEHTFPAPMLYQKPPQIARPILIPQMLPSSTAPYLRCRVPFLETHYSLPSTPFITMLDSINLLMTTSNTPLDILNATGGIVGLVPEPTAQITGMAIEGATAVGASVLRWGKVEMYLLKMNEEVFKPRGLRISVVKNPCVRTILKLKEGGKLVPSLEREMVGLSRVERVVNGVVGLGAEELVLDVPPLEEEGGKEKNKAMKMIGLMEEKEKRKKEQKAMQKRLEFLDKRDAEIEKRELKESEKADRKEKEIEVKKKKQERENERKRDREKKKEREAEERREKQEREAEKKKAKNEKKKGSKSESDGEAAQDDKKKEKIEPREGKEKEKDRGEKKPEKISTKERKQPQADKKNQSGEEGSKDQTKKDKLRDKDDQEVKDVEKLLWILIENQ